MNGIKDKIRELNAYIRENFLKISIVLFVVFLLSSVLSYFFVLSFPQEKIVEVAGELETIFDVDNMMAKSGLSLFWAIFVNNLQAAGVSMVSAVIPVLFFPLWSVISNGIISGMVFAVGHHLGVENLFLLFLKVVLPHAIFEIPILILSNAIGLRFCILFIKKILGKAKGESFRYHFDKASEITFLYIIPLLLLAAFIEGVLEPLIFGI